MIIDKTIFKNICINKLLVSTKKIYNLLKVYYNKLKLKFKL